MARRRKDVLELCLKCFVENGLLGTSTRDLSASLNLQSGGIYYHFQSKEDVVLACAEEAAKIVENNLVSVALANIKDPEALAKGIKEASAAMAGTMQFLVTVCVSKKYKEMIKPVLDRLTSRYDEYAGQIAAEIGCDKAVVEPYVYSMILAVTNYMIFVRDEIVDAPLEMLKKAHQALLDAAAK